MFNNYKMKDELFKQKLSEVAEWHIPKVELGSNERRKLKGKDEQFYQRHQEEFLKIVNGVVPGTQPVVTKLKLHNTDCEDCGKCCPNGRSVLHKISVGAGLPRHMRNKCESCGLWQDPRTGKYTVKTNNISNVWIAWAVETGLKKTKKIKTSDLIADALPETK